MYNNRFYQLISSPINVSELARKIDCEVSSDLKEQVEIKGINSLENAGANELSFLNNNQYINFLKSTKASACIVSKDLKVSENLDIILLRSANPYYSFTKSLNLFYSSKKQYPNKIMSSAIISDKAKIGNNCFIGHNVTIEAMAEIGDDSIIEANTFIDNGVIIGKRARISSNVSISYSIIGDDVVILAGAKIGNDGFGFSTNNGKHYKIFHIGQVIIGNDVEIGANTTIDRGSLNDTVIADNSRIDNLVQIAHNVTIGKGSIIAGLTGIAGSTSIGQYCAIGGQVGIAGHLKIGNQAQIAGGSGVIQNVTDKEVVGGLPAIPIKQWHRQTIMMKKLLNKTNT